MKMFVGVVVLFVVLGSVPAYAVDTMTVDIVGTPVVISVSAANKVFLNRLLTRENTRRAGEGLAALVLNEFVRDLIVDMFKIYKGQSDGFDYVGACATYKVLSGANQTTILSLLGGLSPCP